ncbi:hypothetical protein LUW77_26460 [Streptomyces radiopugnans]|nr:hypothetical protein LUW77_26460 [Streptomyces radiopugnans]
MADRLSTLLLVVALAVSLAVLVFAIGQGTAEGDLPRTPFHPAYLLLVAGVALAFLTGDLFNLFVAFELMLASSYVLINLGAGEGRIRAGMTYTITSLLSSLLFLTAIGLIYAATGTVNLADLGDRVPALPEGIRSVLSLLLLIVFGIKAAVVPLHFWLPDSYPTAPAPITAVLAALLTKVGLYAMVRTQTLLFPRSETWTPLLVAAALTLLVGIVGAVAQQDVNRLLSFVLVSHIGFMLFGLSLYTVGGLTGTVLYAVHHIAAQAALFLIAGLVVGWSGTAKLSRLARTARRPGCWPGCSRSPPSAWPESRRCPASWPNSPCSRPRRGAGGRGRPGPAGRRPAHQSPHPVRDGPGVAGGVRRRRGAPARRARTHERAAADARSHG